MNRGHMFASKVSDSSSDAFNSAIRFHGDQARMGCHSDPIRVSRFLGKLISSSSFAFGSIYIAELKKPRAFGLVVAVKLADPLNGNSLMWEKPVLDEDDEWV